MFAIQHNKVSLVNMFATIQQLSNFCNSLEDREEIKTPTNLRFSNVEMLSLTLVCELIIFPKMGNEKKLN